MLFAYVGHLRELLDGQFFVRSLVDLEYCVLNDVAIG